MTTRTIIDYAYDDNAKDFRDALYSSIQDRVLAHIEAKKQEIAQGLVTKESVQSVSEKKPKDINELELDEETANYVKQLSESSMDDLMATLHKAKKLTPPGAEKAHKHLDKAERHAKAGDSVRTLYHAARFYMAARKYGRSN